MDFQIENTRIFSVDESGKLLAEITFPKEEKGYCINHTFVDESLRGQGIASKLVEMAVAEIKKQEGEVTAICPYAVKWLEKHPQ